MEEVQIGMELMYHYSLLYTNGIWLLFSLMVMWINSQLPAEIHKPKIHEKKICYTLYTQNIATIQ